MEGWTDNLSQEGEALNTSFTSGMMFWQKAVAGMGLSLVFLIQS